MPIFRHIRHNRHNRPGSIKRRGNPTKRHRTSQMSGAFSVHFLALQRAGGEAVFAQDLDLGVAQVLQLPGGLGKVKGQLVGGVGVGGDDHIAAEGQPLLQNGRGGEEILRKPRATPLVLTSSTQRLRAAAARASLAALW